MRFLPATVILFSVSFAADDIDVPSNVANRTVSVKGTLLCGKKPFEGAKIRLYRTPQFDGDVISQIVDEKVTYITGMFQLEGNTAKFPKNETEFHPWITIHHACDEDKDKVKEDGFRRFNFRIPDDYVTIGTKARKIYNFGILNLQLELPGEVKTKFVVNPKADLKPAPIPDKLKVPQEKNGTTRLRRHRTSIFHL